MFSSFSSSFSSSLTKKTAGDDTRDCRFHALIHAACVVFDPTRLGLLGGNFFISILSKVKALFYVLQAYLKLFVFCKGLIIS